jgi:pimeloyl-ACP methyl ester carboxylesterase
MAAARPWQYRAMPTIAINGTELCYEDTGGGGVPIVFSHGLLWSGRMYDPQVTALRGRYRCITYDHRGQGQSATSATPYDMEVLTDDAAALIEKLGAWPCHFVGLSMGGFVGLRLASRKPALIRSLTLIESAADAEPAWNVPKYRAMSFIARHFGLGLLVPAVMRIMFGRAFLRDPTRAVERAARAAELRALAVARVEPALESVVRRRPVESELTRVRVPTLVLHGEDDRAIVLGRARKTAQAIAGARLVVLPRAGHTSSLEEPALVTRELSQFVDSHT